MCGLTMCHCFLQCFTAQVYTLQQLSVSIEGG
jgi:hypothetical protein